MSNCPTEIGSIFFLLQWELMEFTTHLFAIMQILIENHWKVRKFKFLIPLANCHYPDEIWTTDRPINEIQIHRKQIPEDNEFCQFLVFPFNCRNIPKIQSEMINCVYLNFFWLFDEIFIAFRFLSCPKGCYCVKKNTISLIHIFVWRICRSIKLCH
jgi:hypothetical protein